MARVFADPPGRHADRRTGMDAIDGAVLKRLPGGPRRRERGAGIAGNSRHSHGRRGRLRDCGRRDHLRRDAERRQRRTVGRQRRRRGTAMPEAFLAMHGLARRRLAGRGLAGCGLALPLLLRATRALLLRRIMEFGYSLPRRMSRALAPCAAHRPAAKTAPQTMIFSFRRKRFVRSVSVFKSDMNAERENQVCPIVISFGRRAGLPAPAVCATAGRA